MAIYNLQNMIHVFDHCNFYTNYKMYYLQTPEDRFLASRPVYGNIQFAEHDTCI